MIYRVPVIYAATCKSNLGPITAGFMDGLLIYLAFERYPTGISHLVATHVGNPTIAEGRPHERKILATIIETIETHDYRRRIQLKAMGTPFQEKVWTQLLHIPLGETRTYKQVAEAIGEPGKYRAVARACAANPIAVLIPCHRVVQTNGQLGGYHWGTELKAQLLDMEVQEAEKLKRSGQSLVSKVVKV